MHNSVDSSVNAIPSVSRYLEEVVKETFALCFHFINLAWTFKTKDCYRVLQDYRHNYFVLLLPSFLMVWPLISFRVYRSNFIFPDQQCTELYIYGVEFFIGFKSFSFLRDTLLDATRNFPICNDTDYQKYITNHYTLKYNHLIESLLNVDRHDKSQNDFRMQDLPFWVYELSVPFSLATTLSRLQRFH